MASNVVAFIGYESFDIILYLSRILRKMGRKVLTVDYSETLALTYSTPKVDGIDTYINTITFRSIDFTRIIINEKIAAEYDDILIDCGYITPNFNLSILTRVVFVTDMFKFNLKRLRHIYDYDDLQIKRELLIREASDLKITAEQMALLIMKRFDDHSLIYRDENDYANALVCHYNQVFRFHKLSASLKKYLLKEAKILAGNVPDRIIGVAYRNAKKEE